MVNELSAHGIPGTCWHDIKEKGTRYEVQQVMPHLVVTKDPFRRPTEVPLGPDGAMLAQLVEDHHIPVRMESVLASGLSSSSRAAAAPPQAVGFPMDAGMRKALDDTMDFLERSLASRP